MQPRGLFLLAPPTSNRQMWFAAVLAWRSMMSSYAQVGAEDWDPQVVTVIVKD